MMYGRDNKETYKPLPYINFFIITLRSNNNLQISTAIYCDCIHLQGWCGFVEWSHICCRRVWWHGPPVFRRGVQHPHRLLDHCGQYDHTTLLRRSHGPEGPSLCHCRVRCQYSMVDCSLLDLCLGYYQKINECLKGVIWCDFKFSFLFGVLQAFCA